MDMYKELEDDMIISDTPIKSVFEFNEYNMDYEINISKGEWGTKVINLINGKTEYIDEYIVGSIYGEPIEHKHEYDIYLPFLKVGEEFYLEDIDFIVTIKNIMRTSNNKIIYNCKQKITISDEASAKRMKLQKECNEMNDKLLEQYKEGNYTGSCVSKDSEKKKGLFARLFRK